MSDYLDITRVQKALRHASNMGHDVLTDPKTVHIDGTKYGMALGHTLSLKDYHGGGGGWGTEHLESNVLQSESPLVSSITTGRNIKTGYHSRGVDAMIPLELGYERHDEEGTGHDRFFEINYQNGKGIINANGVWAPHPDMTNKTVKDIHEHLATHNKIDTSKWHAEGRLKNLGESMKILTAPLPPFSNLINVEHYTNVGHPTEEHGFQRYTYNPETEQLLKHKGEREEY